MKLVHIFYVSKTGGGVLKEIILKSLGTLLLMFVLAGCVARGPSSRYLSDENEIARLNNAVVALVTPTAVTVRTLGLEFGERNTADTHGLSHQSYCAGFFVSPTEVVTASHCVSRNRIVQGPFGPKKILIDESPLGDSIKVSTLSMWIAGNQGFYNYKNFIISKFDKIQDIAVLTLDDSSGLDVYSTLRLGSPPLQGAQVYALGHTAQLPWTLTQGVVSHPWRIRNLGQLVIQATAQILPGNSGGPLVNERGEIVGVATSFLGAPHLSFFTHTNSITHILYD